MFLRKVFVIAMVLIAVSLSAGVINIPFSSEKVTFVDNIPNIAGFNKLQIPGTPILPAESKIIALPAGSEVISVNVEYGKAVNLGKREITIAPPSLPLSVGEGVRNEAIRKWKKNKVNFVSSSQPFPLHPISYSKMSNFRNIPFVKISYFPILFCRGELIFYPSCNVRIEYANNEGSMSIPDWVSRKASVYFSNWNDTKGYYKNYSRADSFDYVILSKDNLFGAFDSLVNWKNSIGFKVKLVSVDSVIAQYPGSQTPDKIRNFLIDKYIPWGIHYFLIGGNVDMIPMKMCYPDSEHMFDTPTDYYYAELTDDWDSDGDGFYGEYSQDSIGFVPEVIVGRFPYNDVDTLGMICQKTVNFERDTGNWKKRALLLGAFSNFANEDNTGWPDCDGAVLMETIKDSLLSGWTYTRMYEEAGLCPSVYPHEYALTRANVIAEWSSGEYSIVPWFGHGNSNGAYRKWWSWDDGDSIPESSEMDWASFMYITDTHSLDDTHPSIVFAASCDNAEGDTNLARAMIANGASGIIAATRYGWYTPGWDDPSDGDLASLNYYFYYYLVSQNEKVGDALFDSKVYYFNNLYFPDPWAGDPDWSPQQNLLDYTLFGDPSLVREGVGVQEQERNENVVLEFSVIPNLLYRQTEIKYALPFDGDLSISVYNVAGQKVCALHKGSEKAGLHRIQFNKGNLRNGVYFIRMKFEGNKITRVEKRKLILL